MGRKLILVRSVIERGRATPDKFSSTNLIPAALTVATESGNARAIVLVAGRLFGHLLAPGEKESGA